MIFSLIIKALKVNEIILNIMGNKIYKIILTIETIKVIEIQVDKNMLLHEHSLRSMIYKGESNK